LAGRPPQPAIDSQTTLNSLSTTFKLEYKLQDGRAGQFLQPHRVDMGFDNDIDGVSGKLFASR